MSNIKCPVCGAPATLEESGWCFCTNTACLCAWSVMCTDKIAALAAERDALRDQVAALTEQLEAEEAAVKRLREVILGAPKGIVLGDVRRGQRYIGAWQGACIPEDWKVGTKLALVRLDGLGLADTGDAE